MDEAKPNRTPVEAGTLSERDTGRYANGLFDRDIPALLEHVERIVAFVKSGQAELWKASNVVHPLAQLAEIVALKVEEAETLRLENQRLKLRCMQLRGDLEHAEWHSRVVTGKLVELGEWPGVAPPPVQQQPPPEWPEDH